MNPFLILYFVMLPFFFGGVMWAHRFDKTTNVAWLLCISSVVAGLWPFMVLGAVLEKFDSMQNKLKDRS